MDSALVLVIASDTSTQAWIAGRVAGAGHRPLAVPGAQALRAVLSQERPDMVILEERMPALADHGLAELAPPRNGGATVLVVSEDRSIRTGVEAMKRGADDFLVLPCAPEAFDAALERTLRISRTRRRIVVEAGLDPAGCPLMGPSQAMRRARDVIEQLAGADATTVLIEGETGTGKEVVARAIHAQSARAAHLFLSVNCAALPDGLLDSELFGHDRGAFTAAHAERPGIFEAASGGTVLLDEMGDLPAGGQAKLLRLLENRTFRRVGGVEERIADVRVIAATHRDLGGMVARGTFRSDLYFRLNVVRIELPPLRDRPEDVSALAACFIARFNERLGRSVRGISGTALEALERHSWPGNVRELRNVIERAFILHPLMEELQPGHLPAALRLGSISTPGAVQMPADLGLPDAERWLLADAMRRACGNQARAARMLGISRPTLRYRLRKHGLGCARRLELGVVEHSDPGEPRA
jgi:DNA-binding NtrC family response regulator